MRGSGEEMVGGTRVGRRIWGWVLALHVVLGKSFPFQRQRLPSPEEVRVPSSGTPRTQGSKSGWRESWARIGSFQSVDDSPAGRGGC